MSQTLSHNGARQYDTPCNKEEVPGIGKGCYVATITFSAGKAGVLHLDETLIL